MYSSFNSIRNMKDEQTSEYFKRMFHSRHLNETHFDVLKTILGPNFTVGEPHTFCTTHESDNYVTAYQILMQNLPTYIRFTDVQLVEKLEDRLALLRSIEFTDAPNRSLWARLRTILEKPFREKPRPPFPVVLFYKKSDLFYIGGGEWRPNAREMRLGTDITQIGVRKADMQNIRELFAGKGFDMDIVSIDEYVAEGMHLNRYDARARDADEEKLLFERFPDKERLRLKRARGNLEM